MSDQNYYFDYKGKIKTWPGIKLTINEKVTHNEIGYVYLIDVDIAYDYDLKIKNELSFIENHEDHSFIKENETIFLHDLFINENYRNKGYGKLIRKKTEEICKKYNYSYLTSITNKKNKFSNKINEGLDYKILENYKDYNFFYKKI